MCLAVHSKQLARVIGMAVFPTGRWVITFLCMPEENIYVVCGAAKDGARPECMMKNGYFPSLIDSEKN